MTLDLSWWFRSTGLATGLVGLILGVGTAGYTLIEGWPLWDALYMTVISVTTVGYGEVRPLSVPGQAFTVVLLVSGVGVFLYVISLFGGRIVESGLDRQWERRRRTVTLRELEGHFIVCGYGRIGAIIAIDFSREKVPFVIVERDPRRVHEATAAGYLAVEGDASSEEVLRRVGVERARGLIASVSTDAENVFTILSARIVRPELFIIGRAESSESISKLERAGANRVISPYQIGAQQMAQSAVRPAVVEFVQLVTSSDFLDLSMEQVEIGHRSPLSGKTIKQAAIGAHHDVIVIAVQRSDHRMEFAPANESVLGVGDQLVVIGSPPAVERLRLEAAGLAR